MNRKVLFGLAAVAAAFVLVTTARAATSSPSTFQAKAKVNANCIFTAGSFSALDFATYDPLVTNASTGIDKQTAVSLQCTKGAANVTLQLDGGQNAGTGTVRQMKNQTAGNTDTLSYTLTKPSAVTGTTITDSGTAWLPGDTVAIPSTALGTTSTVTVNIYGHLAGGQNVSDGDYLDTVSATINF